jgi:AraC family carnitine catabolism transcriptional activator
MTESAKPTTASGAAGRPSRVAFFLVPRFNMLALMAVLEPMRAANYLAGRELYAWDNVSLTGGPVAASNGIAVETRPLSALGAEPDMVVLAASWGADHVDEPELSAWLRRLSRRGAILVAIEMAVHLLARAGLLAGRRATIHWSWLPAFAERYGDVEVGEHLYVIDGTIATCAGGTAGLDLMLALIAREHGGRLAAEVADQLLHHPSRPAAAPQRHTLGAPSGDLPQPLRAAVALIEAHIAEPLAMPEIARRLGLSQRRLERMFRRHMGSSAVRFSQLLRLQHARVLLTSTAMGIREVSAACGFNSMTYFSAAFRQCFGKRPSEYRQAWPADEPAPVWPVSFGERPRAP